MAKRATLTAVQSNQHYSETILTSNFNALNTNYDDFLHLNGVGESGNTMLGNMDMGGFTLKNVTAPSAAFDVATRAYADQVSIDASSGSISVTFDLVDTGELDLVSLILRDSDGAAGQKYTFGVSDLVADRIVTLPLLTGDDEFVFKEHAVTMTNKTLTSPTINAGALSGTFSGNPIFSGLIAQSISNDITAGTTQTQAGATALTRQYNRVAIIGTNGDGVKLPTAVGGLRITIVNADAAQTLQIWPNTSDAIDIGGANNVDANSLAAGASREYWAVEATNWFTIPARG